MLNFCFAFGLHSLSTCLIEFLTVHHQTGSFLSSLFLFYSDGRSGAKLTPAQQQTIADMLLTKENVFSFEVFLERKKDCHNQYEFNELSKLLHQSMRFQEVATCLSEHPEHALTCHNEKTKNAMKMLAYENMSSEFNAHFLQNVMDIRASLTPLELDFVICKYTNIYFDLIRHLHATRQKYGPSSDDGAMSKRLYTMDIVLLITDIHSPEALSKLV